MTKIIEFTEIGAGGISQLYLSIHHAELPSIFFKVTISNAAILVVSLIALTSYIKTKKAASLYDSMHTFRIQNKGINVIILSYM